MPSMLSSTGNTKQAASWPSLRPAFIKVGELGREKGIVQDREMDMMPYELDEAPDELAIWVRGNDIYLCIPAKEVHAYKLIHEFMVFITDTVIAELMQGGGVYKTENVDTVVISGRGALWPNLHERIWDKFPNADKPDNFLKDGNSAKEAVVKGAIAWQELQEGSIEIAPPPPAKLGILLENDMLLKMEDEWGNIDLSNNGTFRLVQVSLQKPNPRSDMKSLKKHLYIYLDQVRRDYFWQKEPVLIVKQTEKKGKKIIRFENPKGNGIDLVSAGSVSHTPSRPPWPIGQILLTPEQT